jgi:hypothetical protein
MKAIFLASFFLLATFGIIAQEYQVEKLSESNPANPDEVYSFPILKGGNKDICEKINKYLLEDQLYIEYGSEKTSIFENVWQSEEQPVAMIYSLEYGLEILNENMYSVTISGEFCGAYCEEYNTTYTFDLKTGELITLSLLFTEDGLEALKNDMIKNKQETIATKIKEINTILAAESITKDDQSFYTEMLDLYESCDYEMSTEDLEFTRFIPANDYLIVVYGRCSAHYNMYVDELWYFELELPFEKWNGLFSDYAKDLF